MSGWKALASRVSDRSGIWAVLCPWLSRQFTEAALGMKWLRGHVREAQHLLLLWDVAASLRPSVLAVSLFWCKMHPRVASHSYRSRLGWGRDLGSATKREEAESKSLRASRLVECPGSCSLRSLCPSGKCKPLGCRSCHAPSSSQTTPCSLVASKAVPP